MNKKYYVSSGDLNTVILGTDAMDAAVNAIKRSAAKDEPPAIGLVFGVSEHTFEVDNYADDDVFIHSMHVVKNANLGHIYKIDEASMAEYLRELQEEITEVAEEDDE